VCSVGVIAFIAVFFLVKRAPAAATKRGDTRNWIQRLKSIDWLGTVLILGLVTCLTLATTWGSGEKGWGSGAVIAVGLDVYIQSSAVC
jgi:multisubunit Na+/H+ antiporter MnhB subunit